MLATVGVAVGVSTLVAAAPALAQSGQPSGLWPQRVTLIVPYAAGGVTDRLTRALATQLGQRSGSTFVVDNKPGGGTVIGTAAAARAAADGATLLVTSFGFIGNQLMLPSLPYDPKALSPLALIGESTGVLYVHPSVPANNVAEFARWMRAQPQAVTFASSGNGSSVHVMAELFASGVGKPIVHVPYKGNAPGLMALMGGQVQAMFDSAGAMSHASSGRLRALAVSTAQRSSLVPDLPTVAESGEPGLKGFDAGSWFGVFVPAGVAAATQARMHADIAAVLSQEGMRAEVLKTGVEPRQLSQQAFADFLDRQRRNWGPVIRDKGIRPD
jgi:tripartite-type tricarboxylate transporter receptor subunit TctC